jgi:diadenosine tetraphosphate (Ap4A) HIT family hydrolase
MTIDDVVPAATSTPAAPPPGASCVFCEIVAGQAEASLVYADDVVIAFMDVAPINPGHVLVVPREHAPRLADLNEDCGTQVWRTAHRLAKALPRSGLRVDGVNLLLADGAAAFQEVSHVHLHVLPRYVDDGFRIEMDHTMPERSELDTNAAKIGRALNA